MFSPLEQFDVVYIFADFVYFFPFLNIIVPFLITTIIIWFIFSMSSDVFKLIPVPLQRFFEILFEFIFNLIKQQIGKEGYQYFPLIFCLFNLILILNLLSLLPFGIALTSHIIMIIWLTISLWLSIFGLGIYRNNIKFLKIFIPRCPLFLVPMLICIEMFSYTIRAFSLAIRLSANIMAGHTLVFIISTFVINITKIKFWFFFIGFGILFLILALELGVAFLQAYVFTTLTCIYFSEVLNFTEDH